MLRADRYGDERSVRGQNRAKVEANEATSERKGERGSATVVNFKYTKDSVNADLYLNIHSRRAIKF